MTIRPIRLYGDPVLASTASPVTEFDSSLEQLVVDMLDTMDDAGGVGLAANQVGVLQRVFVFDTSAVENGLRGHIINPVWQPVGSDMQYGNEGCLSIPDLDFELERYNTVCLRGYDVGGRKISLVASGLLSRCIQHEADHLDGVMYVTKLDVEQRKKAMAQIRNAEWFQA